MRHSYAPARAFWLIAVLLLISACGSTPSTPVPAQTAQPTVPAFSWDQKPGVILVRFDRAITGESAVDAMNRLPLCSLYGDGYLRWINPAPPLGEEVFEARISEATVRSFIDYLIREQRYFSIPDYASRQLPPTGKFATDSVTLNINNEARIVRSYGVWPQNEFNTMLDKCTHLSSEPVAYLPTGAWLYVQPVAGSPDPIISWSVSAGFRLGDVAAAGKPMWISGEVLGFVWNTLHRTLGTVQWVEDDKAYKLGLQVPGVSRESLPPPVPTPAMPVFQPTATATFIPTRTPRGPIGGPVTEVPPTPTAGK